MKVTLCLFAAFFVLTNCGDNKAATNESNVEANGSAEKRDQQAKSSSQGDNIIGAWKLTMWIRDNNRNGKIEEDEKAGAITQVNDYMKLNADGSAVFSQVKIKGRYEIKPNSDGTSKYLNLFDEANSRYQKGVILSVTKTELTLLWTALGGDKFTVWKRL
jgi:hypothetical protein